MHEKHVEEDSSRKDSNNKKKLLIININNGITTTVNSSLPRRYIIKSVAFLHCEEVLKLLEDVKVRCKVDGLSFSRMVLQALKEYLQRHPVPNPQLLMSYYVNSEEPQPMRVLCMYCQGALSSGEVYCQRRGMWVKGVTCYSCRFNRLRKEKR